MLSASRCYRRIQAETADRGRILLLLYEGIIREIKKAKVILESGDGNREQQGMLHLLRAQTGIVELDRSLNHNVLPELAQALHGVYLHLIFLLAEVMESRDYTKLDRACSMLESLLESWQEAVAEDRRRRKAAG